MDYVSINVRSVQKTQAGQNGETARARWGLRLRIYLWRRNTTISDAQHQTESKVGAYMNCSENDIPHQHKGIR